METFLNYFWLLAIVANGLNAVIFWMKAQPYIQKQPDLRPGYIRLIRGFLLSMNVPWVVMGFSLTTGGVSSTADYLYPRTGNQLVVAWWISVWSLILLLSHWILFRGGAEHLIKHPGLLRGNPTNPKTIKLLWLLAVIGNIVASGVIFSLKPR
jgi:hypothetical protein